MKLINEDINKELNPKLWDGDVLKPEIIKSLENIKDKFLRGLNKLGIPIVVVDSWIVGSNVSYNYNDLSDLDYHILVDIKDQENPAFLLLLYDYYKSSFNDKYSIKLRGIDVEMYIQNKDSPIISRGIYSVDNNKWIQHPKQEEIPDVDISANFDYMYGKFNEILALNNKDKAQSFLDTLHLNRARSLALDGEFGVDNLVFKAFRNKGYIQALKDIIKNGESAELSLESLSQGLTESAQFRDLTGQQFGELTVLGRAPERNKFGQILWRCKCSCGKVVNVVGGSLLDGRTTSCGHRLDDYRHSRFKDLTGQQFGELTVIEKDEEKSKSSKETYWKCKCSCGKECSVARKHLLDGTTKSCGHGKSQNGLDHTDNFDGMRYRQNKYNTNVEVIRNQKMQPNNTSGVKGVHYNSARGRWVAGISLGGKEIRKDFKDKEDAIKYRQELVKKYYQPIIDKAAEEGDLK